MKQSLLFLCTGNSCRSQMAEGLLRHLAGDRYEVASAGTHPAGLNPGAVEVMKEIGIDISMHRSKHINEFVGLPIDIVITVCDRASESCPNFPGAISIRWSFEDPAATPGAHNQHLPLFRRVRDEIAAAIETFLANQRTLQPTERSRA